MSVFIFALFVAIISFFAEWRVNLIHKKNIELAKHLHQSNSDLIKLANSGRDLMRDYMVVVNVLEDHFETSDIELMFENKKQEMNQRNLDDNLDEFLGKYTKEG